MRRLAGLSTLLLVTTSIVTGCASSSEPTAGSSVMPRSWATPQDVIDGVKAAGFDCTMPTSDPVEQVLTKDPFTGQDLGGNALVRCPDFQVMLAATGVDDGFALLVACQAVSDAVKTSAAWATKVLVGSNFVILPTDLTAGWTAAARPADFAAAFDTTESTFGDQYDRSCAGRIPQGPTVPSVSPTSS
jgi:hypothetical protein